MLLKRLNKSKSLRIVNLLGLIAIFACLALSYAFIKKEWSYDRFHEKADRIARLSIRINEDDIDGRCWGYSKDNPVLTDIAGIEDMVFFSKMNTGVVTHNDIPHIINDFYFTSSNFFDVFSFKLLEGDKNTVLNTKEKVAISQSYARHLFGEESPIGKELKISFRRIDIGPVFVSGVFEDFPEASHFHTDLIVHREDAQNEDWTYIYLLLAENARTEDVTAAIAARMEENNTDNQRKVSPYVVPLTDIHLHSRVLRELEPNGNITYIYLIAGANILLLLIVLFNLWLNTGLIFSFNKKYYQLLRLNGASSAVVLWDEVFAALVIGGIAVLAGGMIAFLLFPPLHLFSVLSWGEFGLLSLLFLAFVLFISVLPAVTRMSTTLFRYDQQNQHLSNFNLAKVKYMLIAQYGIVMLVVIIGFGISKQMKLIKSSQVGGHEQTILVMNEQPDIVQERFEVLKNELLKYPEIKSVTSAMQLPGSAIRDHIQVRLEGESESESHIIPLLVVGNDFLPFFNIKPIAGTVFTPTLRSYKEEDEMFLEQYTKKIISQTSEEYVINRKTLDVLGLHSPEEAIGKIIHLTHGSIGYINKGKIVGVTDDFNYTTTFEEAHPQLIVQRKMFQHCIMVYLSPEDTERAIETFNRVYSQVYPDYPVDYSFLQNIYADIYHNEIKAEALVRIFSLLCLIIANLGLIIISSFVIRRKTKEIGVRKVNGATPMDIIRMLNNRFVAWIAIAFVVAIPCAYLAMTRWLEHFAQKTEVSVWIYLFAGLLVLFLSLISISWQSYKAATINPVRALKTE